MADKTENIKTRLSFDGEAEYKAACREINSTLKVLNSEMKLVTAEYKDNASSVEALRAKQDVLKKSYDEQKKKVDETQKALDRCRQATGENSEESKKLETTLNYQKAALVKNEQELKNTEKALEDAGKAADDMGEDVKKSGTEAEKAESKFSGLGDTVKKIGGVMATAMAAAATAAAAAVGTLTTKAIEGYADYEQLVGGVETLFGSSYGSVEEYAEGVGMSMEMAAQTFNDYQNRQQTVLDNANNAYKTAGLSANEYMETVTGFAAALNSSLGEYAWQSGNYADMAITDMADNANKMGTSMESIQNAYMGFSKQNYTMLDNLKLGYGGTKEEMQRLLSDAEKLEGLEIGSLDVSNFADVVTAIHAVQENLGITGTTAKEASTTIQGSIATAKSAWENWLTGMADSEADFSALTGNLVDAVLTVVDNLIPRIIETIPRVVSGLGELATELAAYIPQLMNELLPPLMDGVRALLTTLVSMLPEMLSILSGLAPQIIDIILQLLPQITEAAIEIVVGLAEGIGQALPELIPSIIDAVLTIAQTLIEKYLY